MYRSNSRALAKTAPRASTWRFIKVWLKCLILFRRTPWTKWKNTRPAINEWRAQWNGYRQRHAEYQEELKDWQRIENPDGSFVYRNSKKNKLSNHPPPPPLPPCPPARIIYE